MNVAGKMIKSRFRWFGDVERRNNDDRQKDRCYEEGVGQKRSEWRLLWKIRGRWENGLW